MEPKTVTRHLLEDHREIKRLLGEMENALEPTDLKRIGDIVDRLEPLVELHRRKEEEIFLPALARCMFDHPKPLAAVTHDHGVEETYLEEVKSFLTVMEDVSFLKPLVDACRSLVQFFRDHLWKEESFIFPCAERSLSDEVKWELLVRMEDLEKESAHAGTAQKET